MYLVIIFIFRYYHVKIQIIVSIPFILCNRGCNVFKCTEFFSFKHNVLLIV